MNAARFDDRLDPATYVDDPMTGVFEQGHPDGGVWVPERIFERLVSVGIAYSLHYLAMLRSADEPITLNRPQVESLMDEIAFVRARLDDRVVGTHASAVLEYLDARVSKAGEVAVTIEGN